MTNNIHLRSHHTIAVHNKEVRKASRKQCNAIKTLFYYQTFNIKFYFQHEIWFMAVVPERMKYRVIDYIKAHALLQMSFERLTLFLVQFLFVVFCYYHVI